MVKIEHTSDRSSDWKRHHRALSPSFMMTDVDAILHDRGGNAYLLIEEKSAGSGAHFADSTPDLNESSQLKCCMKIAAALDVPAILAFTWPHTSEMRIFPLNDMAFEFFKWNEHLTLVEWSEREDRIRDPLGAPRPRSAHIEEINERGELINSRSTAHHLDVSEFNITTPQHGGKLSWAESLYHSGLVNAH